MTFSLTPETPLKPDDLKKYDLATPTAYVQELTACGDNDEERKAARAKQAADFCSFIKDKVPEIQRQRYLDEQSQH